MGTTMKARHTIFFLAMTATLFAQDMRVNSSRSLFSDQKAARIGDAVTVLVIEQAQASNDASTSNSRASDLSLGASGSAAGKALPSASVGISTGNTFKGEGGTKSSGVMKAKISARIDSVAPNGNLIISGSRNIMINGDEQIIKISGVVRPSDIQGDNSVFSYNISSAIISYSGSGVINDSQKPGWITRIFHWIF